MYSVFQSVSWKICISPFDFTHQLQEVHCSNENRSTTFMLSSKCLSLSWFKCLIPVFQISTVITYRYIILMHNRFQDNQIWVLKTHRPFSVYTYMHTPCLMTSDCQTGLWSYIKGWKICYTYIERNQNIIWGWALRALLSLSHLATT